MQTTGASHGTIFVHFFRFGVYFYEKRGIRRNKNPSGIFKKSATVIAYNALICAISSQRLDAKTRQLIQKVFQRDAEAIFAHIPIAKFKGAARVEWLILYYSF